MPEFGDVGLLHPAVGQVRLQPDLARQYIVIKLNEKAQGRHQRVGGCARAYPRILQKIGV